MAKDSNVDAHVTAPKPVKELQKYYQKLPTVYVEETDTQILDLHGLAALLDAEPPVLKVVETIPKETLQAVYTKFLGDSDKSTPIEVFSDFQVYEHVALPGLRLLPSLLPTAIQLRLLANCLLRDLSNPSHLTNVHPHWDITYPPNGQSFFDLPKSTTTFSSKNPETPTATLSIIEFLNTSLRWITLGGQYDWTSKQYPDGPPVPFPQDIKELIHGIFPTIIPEAAICNTYTPGDRLSPHRDVSEEADRDLVSISVGCDALFLISLTEPEAEGDAKVEVNGESVAMLTEPPATATTASPAQDGKKRRNRKQKLPPRPPAPPPIDGNTLIVRIHSGDVVVMGGEARWAWHGVPKVIEGTCPPEISDWPAATEEEERATWKGWISNKRVNLNVRQMYEH